MQLSKRTSARLSIHDTPQAGTLSQQNAPAPHTTRSSIEQKRTGDHRSVATPLVASADRIRRLLATTLREREPA
jgi:hypothetical protein